VTSRFLPKGFVESAATPGPVVPSSRVPLFSARCDGSRGESFHLLSVLVGDYRCFRMFHPTALEFVSFPNDLWWPNRKRRFRLLRISWYGGVIIVRTNKQGFSRSRSRKMSCVIGFLFGSLVCAYGQGNVFKHIRYNGGTFNTEVSPKDWHNQLTVTSDVITC
jgi:hypothetical protein